MAERGGRGGGRQRRRRARRAGARVLLHQASGPRDLGRKAQPGRWREVEGGRAPRLGPRELIGRTTTRRGRFATIDPLRTPRWWSFPRWLGLAFWAGLTYRSFRKAYAEHGGLPGSGRDDAPADASS